ncbi:MAG: tetratricopeptide repeat protein [Acidobacteriota bacterium]
MRRTVAIVVGGLVVAQLAAADPRSDKLFDEGRALLDKHDAQGACAKFTQAIEIDPTAAGTMLNLGLCNEELKKYATALYWFRKAQTAAAEAHPRLPQHEQVAKDHTAALAQKVATISITFAGGEPPAGARVKIDHVDVKPEDYNHAEVDPGHHVLDAGAPHMKNVHEEFDVEDKPGAGPPQMIEFVQGENTITIDRGRTRRRAAIYTAIGGGALLVADGIVALYAYHSYHGAFFPNDANCDTNPSNLDPAPSKHCANTTGPVAKTALGDPAAVKRTTDARNLASTWGTGLFIAGAVAVGVASVLYFTAPQAEKLDQTVFVPVLSPDGGGFAIMRRF